MANLTDKQENFCLEYTLNGQNASQAYRDCYDVGKDTKNTTIWVKAHELLHTDKVSVRVQELRDQKFKGKILDIQERKKLLSDMANDGDIKAIDLLNKMEGVYVEKQKVELTGADGKPVEQKWTVEFKDSSE